MIFSFDKLRSALAAVTGMVSIIRRATYKFGKRSIALLSLKNCSKLSGSLFLTESSEKGLGWMSECSLPRTPSTLTKLHRGVLGDKTHELVKFHRNRKCAFSFCFGFTVPENTVFAVFSENRMENFISSKGFSSRISLWSFVFGFRAFFSPSYRGPVTTMLSTHGLCFSSPQCSAPSESHSFSCSSACCSFRLCERRSSGSLSTLYRCPHGLLCASRCEKRSSKAFFAVRNVLIYKFEQCHWVFLDFLLPSLIDLHHCKAPCVLPLHYTLSLLLPLTGRFQSSVHGYALPACRPQTGVLFSRRTKVSLYGFVRSDRKNMRYEF